MKSAATIAVLLALTGLGACANLTVEVDVLKPSYMSEVTLEEELRLDAVRLVRNDTSERITFIAAQKEVFRVYRIDCFDRMIAEAGSVWSGAQLAQITKSLEDSKGAPDLLSEIDDLFAPMEAELEGIDRRTRSRIVASSGDDIRYGESRPLASEARAALAARRGAYLDEAAEFYAARKNECSAMVALVITPAPVAAAAPAAAVAPAAVPAPAPAAAPAAVAPAAAPNVVAQLGTAPVAEALAEETRTASANATNVGRRIITGDGVLLLDRPEAWAVVSAPEDAWADHYNRASVLGAGGGTDIAITMNSTGDYSVKGFTFDGRATANMVSKVGGQALRLVAAAYGAPIPGPQSGAGASAPAASTAPVHNQAAIAAAAAEDTEYRAALFRIANAILANSEGLIDGEASAASAASASLVHLQAWRSVATSETGAETQ